jgi:hypothetical protein
MSCENPMGGGHAVALNLPAEHIAILRVRLTDWLTGLLDDLEAPERLRNPERSRREADSYQRLLAGLERGEVFVPDEEARAALQRATEAYDRESGYAGIVVNHDAMHGLLALLTADGVRGR